MSWKLRAYGAIIPFDCEKLKTEEFDQSGSFSEVNVLVPWFLTAKWIRGWNHPNCNTRFKHSVLNTYKSFISKFFDLTAKYISRSRIHYTQNFTIFSAMKYQMPNIGTLGGDEVELCLLYVAVNRQKCWTEKLSPKVRILYQL